MAHLAAQQPVAGEGRVQPLAGEMDRVALGHAATVSRQEARRAASGRGPAPEARAARAPAAVISRSVDRRSTPRCPGCSLASDPRRRPSHQSWCMAVIEVNGLQKRYGEHLAVADVSFEVQEGEIFGVLGPNGAGKTTTVECIEGLRVPDGGTIRVLGLDPQRDVTELRRVLGVQLQDSKLPERMTVAEAVSLYSSFYDDPADGDALVDRLGLTRRRDTRFGKLSGGQQQRLAIVLALLGRPRVAVLDELTTGLDPQSRRNTWELVEQVRDDGVTVVLVTHFMEEAERLCDRIALIDAGKVVAIDTPSGLVERTRAPQVIRFRPSEPVDEALLRGLPEVTSVVQRDGRVEITGTGDVLATVTTALAQRRIVAAELRVTQPRLDDAFVALTGEGIR
ncbi:multidrug ABC transporter ATP-binding protein [Pseudonocardia sp. D17]|nr:multidrug ABC transporter ATP-binding protein [Pseudonocardia sp. D17]